MYSVSSHAIMTLFAAFHKQDSRQNRLVCMSYTDLNIVKMEEQITLSAKFNENDFDS